MWREKEDSRARLRHGHGRSRYDDGKQADEGEDIDILLANNDDEAL